MTKFWTILLFYFLSNSFAYSQALSDIMQETYPKRAKNIWLLNGLLATAKASHLTDKDLPVLESYDESEAVSFTYQEKEFSFKIRKKIRDPQLPSILIMAGLNGSLEGRFTKMTMSFLNEFNNYNIIAIETLTSMEAVQRTKFVSLGGLHESFQVLRVANYLFENSYIENRDLYLMGGSSSTFGVFHSVKLLKKNNFNPKKLLVIAGYNDITPILNMFCLSDYKDEECSGARSKFGLTFKTLSKLFLRKLFKIYNEDEDFSEHYTPFMKDGHVNLYDLNVLSFEENKLILEKMYEEIYQEKITFKNIRDYYNKISLTQNLEYIKTPMLWIHAKDDPMAIHDDQIIPFKEATKNNPNVYTYVLKNGGHGAYIKIYGREWTNNVIKLFFNYQKI